MPKNNTQPTTEVNVQAFDVKVAFETTHKTKSALIRHMATLPEFQTDGKPSTSKINKAIGDAGIKMIYQHVRNVLTKPLKKTA